MQGIRRDHEKREEIAKMHHYPFHIGDFRSATAHLSNNEELAYRRALDWYYDTESPIPLETQWVARRLRVDPTDLQTVLNDFFEQTDGGWVHARCDKEIAEYRRISERNRRNGRKGGRPKSLTDKEKNPVGSQSDANGDPPGTDWKGNQYPITNNQEPTRERETRKRAAPAPSKPDDVDQQTWDDWLQLRKSKKAPVTETVLKGARSEAEIAGMPLDAFLQVWCMRGSQGLQADWLRPEERKVTARVAMSFAKQDELARRRRWEEMTGRKWPTETSPTDIIDIETQRIA